MYAEEILKDLKEGVFPQLFYWNHSSTDGNCEISRVNKEAAERHRFTLQNGLLCVAYTSTESDVRAYMQEQGNKFVVGSCVWPSQKSRHRGQQKTWREALQCHRYQGERNRDALCLATLNWELEEVCHFSLKVFRKTCKNAWEIWKYLLSEYVNHLTNS